MAVTIYPSSITWNGQTWDKTMGGPMSVTAAQAGQTVQAWTGDAIWPQLTAVIRAGCRVTVELADVASYIAVPNTMSNLVLTISDGKVPTPGTQIVTIANAIFIGSSHTQPQGVGNMTLQFIVASADGTSNPVA